jgi:hypothetical protein
MLLDDVAYRRIVFDQKDPGHRVFPSRFQDCRPLAGRGAQLHENFDGQLTTRCIERIDAKRDRTETAMGMRIWHQSFTVLGDLPGYEDTMRRHLTKVLRNDTEIVFHGQLDGTYPGKLSGG